MPHPEKNSYVELCEANSNKVFLYPGVRLHGKGEIGNHWKAHVFVAPEQLAKAADNVVTPTIRSLFEYKYANINKVKKAKRQMTAKMLKPKYAKRNKRRKARKKLNTVKRLISSAPITIYFPTDGELENQHFNKYGETVDEKKQTLWPMFIDILGKIQQGINEHHLTGGKLGSSEASFSDNVSIRHEGIKYQIGVGLENFNPDNIPVPEALNEALKARRDTTIDKLTNIISTSTVNTKALRKHAVALHEHLCNLKKSSDSPSKQTMEELNSAIDAFVKECSKTGIWQKIKSLFAIHYAIISAGTGAKAPDSLNQVELKKVKLDKATAVKEAKDIQSIIRPSQQRR